MMMDNILSLVAIVISIINSFFLWRYDKKGRKIRSPLDWSLDVYAFRPNQDPQHNKLTQTYNPSIFEVIFNSNEENCPQCDMVPVSGFELLHSKRKYEFIFIRNASQHAVELLSFDLGKRDDVSIKHILLANNAVLLALPSHGKPSGLIINFSGSSLLYNIKANVGLLRPTDIR